VIAPHNIKHSDVDRVGWSNGRLGLAAVKNPINKLVGLYLDPTFPKNKPGAEDGSDRFEIDRIIILSRDHFRQF